MTQAEVAVGDSITYMRKTWIVTMIKPTGVWVYREDTSEPTPARIREFGTDFFTFHQLGIKP